MCEAVRVLCVCAPRRCVGACPVGGVAVHRSAGSAQRAIVRISAPRWAAATRTRRHASCCRAAARSTYKRGIGSACASKQPELDHMFGFGILSHGHRVAWLTGCGRFVREAVAVRRLLRLGRSGPASELPPRTALSGRLLLLLLYCGSTLRRRIL